MTIWILGKSGKQIPTVVYKWHVTWSEALLNMHKPREKKCSRQIWQERSQLKIPFCVICKNILQINGIVWLDCPKERRQHDNIYTILTTVPLQFRTITDHIVQLQSWRWFYERQVDRRAYTSTEFFYQLTATHYLISTHFCLF